MNRTQLNKVPKAANGKVSPKPKSAAKASAASDDPNPSDSLSALWRAASASNAGKFAESQVWIDKGLYHQIEAFSLKCGKPVPTKHVINAILRMFMDEHKTDMPFIATVVRFPNQKENPRQLYLFLET